MNDIFLLQQVKNYFANSLELKSYVMLKSLCKKYENINLINDFMFDLYTCMYVNESFLGIKYSYSEKYETLHKYCKFIKNKQLWYNFIKMYTMYSLLLKKYKKVKPYLKYLQPVINNNLNINPNTISYVKETEKNKIILIYN